MYFFFLAFFFFLQIFLELFGKYDFLPNKELFTLFAQDSCRRKTIDLICENILFLLGGYDSAQLNMVSTKSGFIVTCWIQFETRIAYQIF